MFNKRSFFIIITVIIAAVIILFLTGPYPGVPVLSTNLPYVASDLSELDSMVNSSERNIRYLRPENRARIIWADTVHKTKTRYSVVYLHGHSGSWMDGYPVNIEFARRYGFNLYLSRLQSHGIDNNDPLLDLTPQNYLSSAAYAISIGERLGDSVIVIATSTGGTLALILAAAHPEISALILYSPNIDLYDSKAFILTMPWGLQAARLFRGRNYIYSNDPPELQKYWLKRYRIESLISLKNLINSTMNEGTFAKVKQPVFMGYFYKNENEQDHTVSVKRELEMFSQLGTPAGFKRKVSFPHSGTHPIASSLLSKDVKNVTKETFRFADEVLKLNTLPDKP